MLSPISGVSPNFNGFQPIQNQPSFSGTIVMRMNLSDDVMQHYKSEAELEVKQSRALGQKEGVDSVLSQGEVDKFRLRKPKRLDRRFDPKFDGLYPNEIFDVCLGEVKGMSDTVHEFSVGNIKYAVATTANRKQHDAMEKYGSGHPAVETLFAEAVFPDYVMLPPDGALDETDMGEAKEAQTANITETDADSGEVNASMSLIEKMVRMIVFNRTASPDYDETFQAITLAAETEFEEKGPIHKLMKHLGVWSASDAHSYVDHFEQAVFDKFNPHDESRDAKNEAETGVVKVNEDDTDLAPRLAMTEEAAQFNEGDALLKEVTAFLSQEGENEAERTAEGIIRQDQERERERAVEERANAGDEPSVADEVYAELFGDGSSEGGSDDPAHDPRLDPSSPEFDENAYLAQNQLKRRR